MKTEAELNQLALQYHLYENAKSWAPKPLGAKRPIALLIAGRNEALVLEHTIMSAVRAGQAKKDIYFVDDDSTDDTLAIAQRVLGKKNVHHVAWGGKGKAIKRAVRHFSLISRYEWIHIADADGAFASDYFKIMRAELDTRYAAATGYIKSLKGSLIGQYRVYEYTFGMEIVRRFQALIGTIPIIPGPTSLFRSDIMKEVNFANGSLTEDFDVTLQIHRKKLGGIQFIEDAVALTQDPLTVRDFIRQIRRWNKGVLLGMMKYRIGTRLSKVDIYLLYQMWLNISFVLSYAVVLPLAAAKHGVVVTLCLALTTDVLMMLTMMLLIAHKARRWDIMASFPNLYGLRWLSIGVFLWSAAEVLFTKKARSHGPRWVSVRRQRMAV
jgi:cellulose synthase/poly-beta-1,6-N-acetylglucosamine synthase-like glycosyltransferase